MGQNSPQWIGLDWINSYSLPLWVYWKEYDYLGAYGVIKENWLQKLLLENRVFSWLASLGSFGTEFLGGVSVFMTPTVRGLIYLALASLHLVIWYTMDIIFWQNIVLLVYLSFDWFQLIKRLLVLGRRWRARRFGQRERT